jgi:hypothetical protein
MAGDGACGTGVHRLAAVCAGRRFVVLAWLSLAGCLDAPFDFPWQIHSILRLFLIICAILFTASGRSSHR